jgi:hypothetical protein
MIEAMDTYSRTFKKTYFYCQYTSGGGWIRCPTKNGVPHTAKSRRHRNLLWGLFALLFPDKRAYWAFCPAPGFWRISNWRPAAFDWAWPARSPWPGDVCPGDHRRHRRPPVRAIWGGGNCPADAGRLCRSPQPEKGQPLKEDRFCRTLFFSDWKFKIILNL